MLIPLEQPYLQGLNSYYLHIDKLVEHLQGEIGSGCLYFSSSSQEILIYFDEQEILRGVIQDNGAHAQVSPTLEPVFEALSFKNFRVVVYQLDPNAIFFWGQMPQFQRAKKELNSSDIQLPDLIFRLKQKIFSGFVHVRFLEKRGGALLFFHKGQRVGGSYTWGMGGLDASDRAYNDLLKQLQKHKATFAIGHFLPEKQQETVKAGTDSSGDPVGDAMFFSSLDTALEEFLDHFVTLLVRKKKTDPVILLKQQFVEKMDEYPFLDPFKAMFDYTDGRVVFSDDAPREKIAAAIVECVWNVVIENRMEKKFRAVLKKWNYKSALEERGIVVER